MIELIVFSFVWLCIIGVYIFKKYKSLYYYYIIEKIRTFMGYNNKKRNGIWKKFDGRYSYFDIYKNNNKYIFVDKNCKNLMWLTNINNIKYDIFDLNYKIQYINNIIPHVINKTLINYIDINGNISKDIVPVDWLIEFGVRHLYLEIINCDTADIKYECIF